MIKLIVALDKNKLIGIGDQMPWNIKEEFAHFKKSTMGDTLLMGRNTFLGLPSNLPGRKMVVLSEDTIDKADLTLHNNKELYKYFDKFKHSKEVLWIAGGKSIYQRYYESADELIISEIKGEYNGDVYLDLDLTNWNKKQLKDYEKFTVYSYTRKIT